MISQYWGKGDKDTINRVIGVGMAFVGVITLVIAAAVVFFPVQIMSVTSGNAELVDFAARYGRIAAVSFFFNGLSMIYISTQQSMENPKFGMYVLLISNVLNIFLNWVLIFGNLGAPELGVEGAAAATLISRVVQFAIVIAYAFRNSRFKLKLALFLRPGRVIFRDFVRYSSFVVANDTLFGLSVSLYAVIIGHMEKNTAATVAANALAVNMKNLIAVGVFGMSMAASIVIGKAIGSEKTADEIYGLGKSLCAIAVIVGIISGVVLAVLTVTMIAPHLYPMMSLTATAQEIATVMLLARAGIIVLMSYNVTCAIGVLRAGGDVRMVFMIDILPMYLFSIPMSALFLLGLGKSVYCYLVFAALGEVIKLVWCTFRYKSRRWINNLTRNACDI